jgi:uroporphyrinogen decarboxylase
MLPTNRQPDFARLRKALLRQGEPDRVPFIELLADREMVSAVVGEPVAKPRVGEGRARDASLRTIIRFWHMTGHDFVPAGVEIDLPRKRLAAVDTADLPKSERLWIDERMGMITSWADFEAYPWPTSNEVDYYSLEFTSRHLPDGMKMVVPGPGGQLENIMWLMGYQGMSYALGDDPALVQAVAERVGKMLLDIYATALQFPNVGAIWINDDMGFKTATMISPEAMRQYVFPWQKRIVRLAHAHGVPVMLHSCGQLGEIMDDLIDDVGIDAKHSYEDTILPVAEAKRQYGHRIAILGGVDVDVLCRASEEQVRAYTRRVLDDCAPGGGYALGTGNSVANYIPVRNYLAMLDEGRRWRY